LKNGLAQMDSPSARRIHSIAFAAQFGVGFSM